MHVLLTFIRTHIPYQLPTNSNLQPNPPHPLQAPLPLPVPPTLTPTPLPQPHPPRVHIGHTPLLTTIPRDPKPQYQLILTNELIQVQQLWLIGPNLRQFKRADQTPRQRFNGIIRRVRAQVERVDAEHVDLALSAREVGGLGLEVELEAKGAGAGARETREGDDDVLVVGVVGVLGDVKGEGDVGGAA